MMSASVGARGEGAAFSLVTFECRHPSAEHEVYVVGDHPALGCWDVAKAVPLHGEGPTRTSAPVSVPCASPIQYKYVLCASGHLVRWESIDGNRTLLPVRAQLSICDELDDRTSSTEVAATLPLPPGPPLPLVPEATAVASFPQAGAPAASDSAVLVVSYILPLDISKTAVGWAIEWNQDSITAKKQQHLSKRVTWIGCPGVHVEEEDREALTSALQEFGCVPIFLESALDQNFYFGFCRSYLWPTFHNVLKSRCFAQKVWRAYCTANRKFADKVIEVYDSGDLVWVHDYHLLLLPSYILRKLRTARVGLFLHTPFPSSEIFRTIPVRDELLRGMLNADLVGFHIFEYARHFLTCCKRLLGLDYEFQQGGYIGVRDHKRNVMVQVSHMGIEPSVLLEAHRSGLGSLTTGWEWWNEIVRSREAAGSLTPQGYLRRGSEGKKVVLSIDEMERLKGTALRLLAFEMLLQNEPELRAKLVFVQINLKTRNYTPADDAAYDEVRV